MVRTAFNVIRLVELGLTRDDSVIRNAVGWLLSTPEPVGLPGLFMHSEDLVRRFNEWKVRPGSKGRPYRGESAREKQAFLDNTDILPNISGSVCEVRVTWSSAVVLEALLRCGLAEDVRVVRSMNTLSALSKGSGGWCGCGYLDAAVEVPLNEEPVDFNAPYPILEGNAKHSIDWFITPAEIENLTCGPGNGRPNYLYKPIGIGGNESMIVKHYMTTGECSMVMYRALSYHPNFHGSNLELHAALRSAWRQSWDGTWGCAYPSSMLGYLERVQHPLSAFLVARCIPKLIRSQGDDGLWEEEAIPSREPRGSRPPTKEESSLMIVMALKRFGFLEMLVGQRDGPHP